MKEMKEFCILRIQRTSGKIKIYCRSEELEEFFRYLSEREGNIKEKNICKEWVGIEGYKIDFYPFQLESAYLYMWGGKLMTDKPNLSFLRAIGLAKGVEFFVNESYTKQRLQKWIGKAEVALIELRELKDQFLSPVDFEVVV